MEYEPFVPTPDALVEAKLKLAKMKPGETLYDLGCGDGRVLISAAQNGSIRAVGIEIRDELIATARAAVREQNLEDVIEVRQEDYLATDLAEADVVIMYLNRGSLGQVSLKLEEELRPGARIVTHEFDLPGWTAEREIDVQLPEGGEVKLFLYRQPAA